MIPCPTILTYLKTFTIYIVSDLQSRCFLIDFYIFDGKIDVLFLCLRISKISLIVYIEGLIDFSIQIL